MIPTAKFVIMLFVLMFICTTMWQFLSGGLYDCTDGGVLPEFWTPGNWIHGHILAVDQIIHNRPMSELDTIKTGWSMMSLLGLWLAFVVGSVAISLLFALKTWIPKRPEWEVNPLPRELFQPED